MNGVLLGSGGWFPTERRETCCVYLSKERAALVIDAGTGLHRLLERGDLLDGVDTLHIVLSHFHLDHVVGLAYLPALPAGIEVRLWGPGQALYGRATSDILGDMFESPFFTAGLPAIVADVRELQEGENDCGPFAVLARRQSRHPEPTLAFRVDDVVYCSDTASDDGNIPFARSAGILLHEAWSPEPDVDAAIHTSARDAGRIAAAAQARELVLIHVRPLTDDGALVAAARREFPAARLGTDLLSFDVG